MNVPESLVENGKTAKLQKPLRVSR